MNAQEQMTKKIAVLAERRVQAKISAFHRTVLGAAQLLQRGTPMASVAMGEFLKALRDSSKWPKWLWKDEEKAIMDELLAQDNIFALVNSVAIEQKEFLAVDKEADG